MCGAVRPGLVVSLGAALACVALVMACGSFGSAPNDGTSDADGSVRGADEASPGDSARGIDASDASLTDAPAEATTGVCKGEAACTRFVFVTSELFAGEDLGGAISGDGKCTVRASIAGTLPALANRVWKVWMSDDVANTSVSARLTHGTMPYRLANGTLIANDWAQLTSGTLLHAIDLDERGNTLGEEFVWTGTTAFGQATLSTCMNWSLNGPTNTGTVGRATAVDSSWTNSGTVACGNGHRLYCIEQ